MSFNTQRKEELAKKICDVLWLHSAKPLSAGQLAQLKELFAQYLAGCASEPKDDHVMEAHTYPELWFG